MLYVVGTVYFLEHFSNTLQYSIRLGIALAVRLKEELSAFLLSGTVSYAKSIKNNRYLFSIAQSYILCLYKHFYCDTLVKNKNVFIACGERISRSIAKIIKDQMEGNRIWKQERSRLQRGRYRRCAGGLPRREPFF